MPPGTQELKRRFAAVYKLYSIDMHLRIGRRFLHRPRYHIVVDRDPQGPDQVSEGEISQPLDYQRLGPSFTSLRSTKSKCMVLGSMP